MNIPDPVQLLRLFQKVAPAGFFRELCPKHGHNFREAIYSPTVVVWLMMWQRLQEEISGATGGYCQARQKLPKLIASAVSDRIVDELRAEMQEGWRGLQSPVFLIDGSTLQLPAQAELRRAFPPGHNQHEENAEAVPLNSALLATTRYQARAALLYLEFRDSSIYRYRDDFNRHIRDCFEYVLLPQSQ